jgi:protein-S-isoprenylcysteine O-methyltransferase Ste14
MNKELFFTLVIVCIITHVVRTGYEILKYKQVLKASKLSFIIIFIDMILLWITWFLLCKFDLFKLNFPNAIKYTGISLSVIGVVIFLISLFTIKTVESHDGDLITTGIYSIIRHPMYLGFILWLIGFPVCFGALFSSGLALLFIANILCWRYLEEKELEKRFPVYSKYREGTIF